MTHKELNELRNKLCEYLALEFKVKAEKTPFPVTHEQAYTATQTFLYILRDRFKDCPETVNAIIYYQRASIPNPEGTFPDKLDEESEECAE